MKRNDLVEILRGKTPIIERGKAVPREGAWYHMAAWNAYQFYPGYGQNFYWKMTDAGTILTYGERGFWDIYTEGNVNRHTILNTDYLIWLGKEIIDGYAQHSK